MLAYNVEFWARDWSFVGSRLITQHENKEDYLSPVNNSITIKSLPGIEVGGFLRVWCNDVNCKGIITGTEDGSIKGTTTVTYKPYVLLLKQPVLFDCTMQGSGYSLEQYIADVITAKMINNPDTLQNVSGLSVEVETNTTAWTLGLKPISEENTKAIVKDFYSAVVVPAMQNYQIAIRAVTDYQNHTIVLKVGRNTAPMKTIELDLKNIKNKKIVIQQTNNSKNKLVVYNQSDDFETLVVYYLHTDGTYDTTDADRITPVDEELRTTTVKEGETLEDKAAQVAANVFNSIKYNNLIEFEVKASDELIKPDTLQIGQTVRILADGKEYYSILTGRKTGETVRLIFGTIRLELTKRIGRSLQNGGSY